MQHDGREPGARLITATSNVESRRSIALRHVELRLDGTLRGRRSRAAAPSRLTGSARFRLAVDTSGSFTGGSADPGWRGQGNGDPRSLSFAVGALEMAAGEEQR